MMFRLVSVAVIALAISLSGLAGEQLPSDAPLAVAPLDGPPSSQAPEPPPGVPSPQSPKPTPVQGKPTPPPDARVAVTPETPPRKVRGRDLNLQVELTLTDQTASAPAEKKVVSMIAADATSGRIRSISGSASAVLNVDARPVLLDNDRVLLELTVEYAPALPENTPQSRRPAALNESLSVILQAGKPMVISQAADPVNDRKMTVEVRVSIVK